MDDYGEPRFVFSFCCSGFVPVVYLDRGQREGPSAPTFERWSWNSIYRFRNRSLIENFICCGAGDSDCEPAGAAFASHASVCLVAGLSARCGGMEARAG